MMSSFIDTSTSAVSRSNKSIDGASRVYCESISWRVRLCTAMPNGASGRMYFWKIFRAINLRYSGASMLR